MKFLLSLIISLMSLASFAQTTQFTVTANVNDPPYGLVAQLWNNSASTVYLDHLDITGAPESAQVATGGVFQFGIGFSYVEENQCKAISMILLDPMNGPQLSTDNSIRASQQSCTPNGLTYGVPVSPGVWNYTSTNTAPTGTPQLPVLAMCWGLQCTLDYPTGLAIPSHHGVTVYTSYYVDDCYKDSTGAWKSCAFGWKGYAAVNFRGRK